VAELSGGSQPDRLGLCPLYGSLRSVGPIIAAPLQRLATSPDGSTVVFEVTDDLLVYPVAHAPAEQEGIWLVRSDGSGLRRLGPASRDPTYRCVDRPCLNFRWSASFAFTPDGRKVAFTDRGPDDAGRDAVQLFVMDLATGVRTQVTHLPFIPPSAFPEIPIFAFLSNETLGFGAQVEPGVFAGFTVESDGTDLRRLPTPAAAPEAHAVPIFQVIGGGAVAYTALLSDQTTEPAVGSVAEVFVLEGERLLQLTSFHRSETDAWFVGVGGRRVFFVASADPLGRNPTANCQLFSISRLGTGLRQLTSFSQGGPTDNGCFGGPPPGCSLGGLNAQDGRTKALVFDSTCDPLGTNPYGRQLFAMRPDGSGLRQLTTARGRTLEPDGTVSVQYVGHWSYSAAKVVQ
jgi:hypothetical protein